MKTAIGVVLLAVGTTIAQQTNSLHTLRQLYEKKEQSTLLRYGENLDTIMANLKQKGDLDNVLILQDEKNRLNTKKAVPAPSDAKDSFRPATEEYYQTRVTLLEQYVTALDGLIKKETAADRIEEAKAVKLEKEKASFILAEMQTKLPVKPLVAKPKTEEPANPVPSLPVFKPKTYVVETKGWAGMEPNNNVYTFQVESVGRRATFRFWASGDIGTATSGQVVLSGPEGKDQIIRSWRPADFKVAANTASSYKKLRPISCDISSYMKQAGEYRFTFKWGGSQIGLSILRVELELQ